MQRNQTDFVMTRVRCRNKVKIAKTFQEEDGNLRSQHCSNSYEKEAK